MMNETIIFKALVGSQAYGTSTPSSDEDRKGIFMQHPDDILSFKYKEFIEVTKDECYWEVRRFLELCQVANPTTLEILFSPPDCIIEKSPAFDLIINQRGKFLTKKCYESFGRYAEAQIRKAQGLDKKMNWEQNKVTRKTILDFCYILIPNGTIPLKEWLERQEGSLSDQRNYGACKIPNARDMFYIYPKDNPDLEYYGLANADETSNELKLCSIPMSENDKGIAMSYNKDGYMKHCKDYKSYQVWLQERNTQRYIDVAGHNQKLDGKNLLHCVRLLDMSIEIATEGTIRVRRPNAEELLKIRRGEVDLKKIIEQAEMKLSTLKDLFDKSGLPDDVDPEFVNQLLLDVRHFKS